MMIDDPELLQFLQIEEARATDTELNDQRATALSMYRGDLFGDEVEGRSKLRTRDVAEAVDYMAVSILRTLVSSDKIVEFEPGEESPPAELLAAVPPEQHAAAIEQWADQQSELAQQATERVHASFMLEQDGYSILHDGIKAGLIEKSGVWKSWVERKFRIVPARLNAAQVESDPSVVDAEIVDGLYDVDEATGEPLAVYDALVKQPLPPRFVDAAIPNEEFFVSPDARSLEAAAYLGNISRVSLYDLVEMGYSEEDVANLWGNDAQAQQLSDARDAQRGGRDNDDNRRDLARVVTLREEYCRWWVGRRFTLVRVHRVGPSILSVEPVEEHPYTLWCPFPMPHRLIGQSLADKTMDIQVVRSHLLRQAMDGIYIANAPRTIVDMSQADDVTIDDLLDVAPGGLIRSRGGASAVQPFVQPFTASTAFEAMEIMAGERESRTGITRLNQGLDADALNKTATGTALMQATGQQMEEYIARNAVNAIGEMFQKKRRLMHAAMGAHAFRIDGQTKAVDPRQWPEEMRLGVRAGLGTGSKEKRIQALTLVGEAQAQVRAVDPRMVTAEEVFSTAKKLTGELGVGIATQFFKDPATLGEQQPPPDPAVIEAQAKAQHDAQAQQFEQQARAEELALKRWQAEQEAQLARDRAEAEWTLAQQSAERDFELKQQQMLMRASTDASIAQNREGGRLDA